MSLFSWFNCAGQCNSPVAMDIAQKQPAHSLCSPLSFILMFFAWNNYKKRQRLSDVNCHQWNRTLIAICSSSFLFITCFWSKTGPWCLCIWRQSGNATNQRLPSLDPSQTHAPAATCRHEKLKTLTCHQQRIVLGPTSDVQRYYLRCKRLHPSPKPQICFTGHALLWLTFLRELLVLTMLVWLPNVSTNHLSFFYCAAFEKGAK